MVVGTTEKEIWSQVGARGPTGRNGGARERWRRCRNTATATSTEAVRIQESLWKSTARLVSTRTKPLPPQPLKTPFLRKPSLPPPCYKETDRDLPWENLMEADYKSSFDQDFAVQQPLNLFSYPNLPSQSAGFIDAWSIENFNSRRVESSISLSEGDLSPSLNLSMAMAVGEVLDEQMRNIETEAPVEDRNDNDGGIEKTIWWGGGGPLGEALQQGASTPASPSGVLHRTLFSHSDGSACNSPTALAPETSYHWNFFP